MSLVGWTQALAIAGAESAGLALLAILLFRSHRRFGLIPFLSFFVLLAVALTATVHQVSLDGGPLGALPHAQATLAPLLLALTLLLHLTRGWRNAQLSAASLLLAAPLVAVAAVVTQSVDLFVAGSTLATDPWSPLIAGGSLWLAALAAAGVVTGLYRVSARCPPFLAVLTGGLTGLAVQATIVIVLAQMGVLIPGTAGWGPMTLPLLAGLPAIVLVGIYATGELAGIWPETRRALISREPLGAGSRLEEARELQERYEEAKQAERQEADTYKQLVESDERGAYVCSPDGRITYANGALTRILEQPDRALVGENIRHVFGGTDERGRPRFANFPVKVGTHRATVQLPNGHKRAVEVTVRPAGEDQLYGRVRDRTEEVLRARVEEQKERAEFYVDLLRHDIGNYVMAPLNYLQLLERRDDLDEEAQTYVEESRESIEDICDLLERIDVLSDVDQIRAEPVDAGEILRSVGRRFARKHPDSLSMTFRLPDQPIAVQGSPLLEEVFVNLVGNAIRHAGTDASIEIGAEADGTEWVLYVADDGPGIPDEEKAAVFDRTKRDGSSGGKGLGLYIVKTITSAIGGDVQVADRVPGQHEEGACFKVRLSAADPARLESSEEPGTLGQDSSERGEAVG